MIKMISLPAICHQMHPDIAAEIERINAWIDDAAAQAVTIKRKLAAIRDQVQR